MKTILVFSFAMVIALNIFGQKITVTEKIEKIAKGDYNSLVVFIPEESMKRVISEWKIKMKNADAKVDGNTEVFADNAKLPDLSDSTIDVYSIFKEKENGVEMIVAFNLNGTFLNSKDHELKFKVALNMLKCFAININEKLEQEMQELEKLNVKNENLMIISRNLESEIAGFKEKIAVAEEDIQKNSKKIEDLKADIDKQKKVVEAVKTRLIGAN